VTAVKICGITRYEDAEAAARFGASYVGFVLWSKSPRAAAIDVVKTIVSGLPAAITPVGVFVNPTTEEINAAADAGIRIAQVHGGGPAHYAQARLPNIRAVHLAPAGDGIDPDVADDLILLDALELVYV
jgi:phosphoribosylanthranilate isomerase